MISSSGYPRGLAQESLTDHFEATLEAENLERATVTSANLRRLGECLGISMEERAMINDMVMAVTALIQQEFTVSRFYIAGSYGRRVTVGNRQIDVIIFLKASESTPNKDMSTFVVNNEFLNYDKYIELLYQHLKKCLPSLSKDWNMHHLNVYKHSPSRRRQKKYLAPPCVHLQAGRNEIFSFYFAPGFEGSPEDQRQISYRYMKAAFETGGLDAVVSWFPSLIECPNAEIASTHPYVHNFIRLCSLWAQLIPHVTTLRIYAVEVLAYLTLKKMIVQQQQQASHHTIASPHHKFLAIDFFQGFQTFLSWCADLKQIINLVEIYPPATFISPWTSYSKPLLTDAYNPYDNLFMCLSHADTRRIELHAQITLKKLQPISDVAFDQSHHSSDAKLPVLHDIFIHRYTSKYRMWLGHICFSLFTIFLVGCSAILMALYLRSDYDVILEDFFERALDLCGYYMTVLTSFIQHLKADIASIIYTGFHHVQTCQMWNNIVNIVRKIPFQLNTTV